MRKISVAALLFAGLGVVSSAAAAQGRISVAPAAWGCPVVFSVARSPSGSVVWTGDKAQTAPRQGVEVKFRPADAARIVKATVIVHGTRYGLMLAPVARPGDELSQTFELDRSDGRLLAEGGLWPVDMGSIRMVEIAALEFTDGTAWRESAPSQCDAVPSLLVLVSQK
jgi:hypothetical protein